MAFDIPLHVKPDHNDYSASHALFADTDSRPNIIKVAGSLEPHGPTGPTTTTPVETAPTTTPATAEAPSNNVIKQVLGGTTVLPSPPGDGCTRSVGLVAGAAGFTLGGIEAHPDPDCNAARNAMAKQKNLCDFTLEAAKASMNGYNTAGGQADMASGSGSRAHLDIANRQAGISSQLSEAARAAIQQCTDAQAGRASSDWGASDLVAPAPKPEPVVHKPHPAVVHHEAPISKPAPKDTTCPPEDLKKKTP